MAFLITRRLLLSKTTSIQNWPKAVDGISQRGFPLPTVNAIGIRMNHMAYLWKFGPLPHSDE
jgi:hypothetical protein